MKLRLSLLSALLLFCSIVFAQQAPSTITIKGLVIDSAKNTPMDYVTVALRDVKTNQGVKSMLSKTDGSFEFTKIPSKKYQLVLAFVGYQNKIIAIDSTTKDINLGKLLLATSSGQLKEVTISAVKPLVKQEVDRLNYDVQSDPESKVLTALDMLRKVPLITVDATDNIKLKGQGNYKILINNKPSSMVARNPADVFKSMPAANIERIEVITTPPAKYDAEGLAGIINIITKKNADQGYNGNISTRYNSIWGGGVNLNATVKQGKFGLNGYVGSSKRPERTTAFSNQQTIFNPGTTLLQDGNRSNSGNNTYGSAELSFEIDSLNLLTANAEFYGGKNQFDNTQSSVQSNVAGIPQNSYSQVSDGSGKYQGTDLGLNYQLGFKRHKEQLLTASYRYSKSPYEQITDNRFTNYPSPNFIQSNNSGTREQTIQLDYVHPTKKLNIEAGAKAILRSSFSDFFTDTLSGTQYFRSANQSNSFNYDQDVYSIYNSYQLKLEKWVLKGGIRLERTTINGNFINQQSTALSQHYNNWVPSFSVQRQLKGNNSINMGYSQRIQRPGIWQLNPFVDSSNVRFINVGNPGLRPVVARTVSTSYSHFNKGNITVGLSYSFANNSVESVTSIDPATAVTTTTYQNVGRNRNLSLDINTSYPIIKDLTFNLNGQLAYIWLTGFYSGRQFSNDGLQGTGSTNVSYKMKNDFRLTASYGYYSRFVMLQGKDNVYTFTSISGSKEFWNKNASVSISVANPFNKFRKFNNYTYTPDFRYDYIFQQYYRNISASISYKFGRLNSSIKKNQRGIQNDDASSGGRRN